jgi:hypothetical protein
VTLRTLLALIVLLTLTPVVVFVGWCVAEYFEWIEIRRK